MIKIAITGPIASGKSLVEEFLRQEGAVTLDTDRVAHKILENNPKVLALFATTDRKQLGEIVFSDTQKLKKLESIIHPEVKRIVQEFFEENKDKKLVAVSVPLLYEANMETMFDYVIMVTANEDIRLQRLMETRNLSKEEALKRIRARDVQPQGDFIIENNDTIDNLQKKVKNILMQIREKH
ncbi:MAG: dephospho-CoA kinase [Candidatus Melainabacteria bacterium GWF2_37_15]|nr:MAG: dephospho-CoA kinase [Candidatus Melainabacteria bacterium GWF2_37_15]